VGERGGRGTAGGIQFPTVATALGGRKKGQGGNKKGEKGKSGQHGGLGKFLLESDPGDRNKEVKRDLPTKFFRISALRGSGKGMEAQNKKRGKKKQ